MDGLSSCSANTSLEETIRIIDHSIETHQKVIDELRAPLLALKSERNTLVPISRLPPETLCNIFSFAQDLKQDSPDGVADPLAWINVTYVCRHWRNVALNAPSLWVEPPMDYPKWVEEMLRRSKDSNLVIKASLASSDSGIVLAFRHTHRIKVLSIQDINADRWNTLQENLPKAIPRLECLCLQGIDPAMDIEEWGGGLFILSEDFPCETERLCQLQLENCVFDWNLHSRLFRSLTHLRMGNISQSSPPTGKQFTDALKNMPELEALTLRNSLPGAEQQPLWGSENIHLAHLRTLSITSLYPEVEAFFGCITFPPTTKVKIVCYESMFDQDISGFIIALARSYSNTTPNITFRSFIQDRPSEWHIGARGARLMFCTEIFRHSEVLPDARVTVQLDLELYYSPSRHANRKLMSNIFNSGIPLHDIDSLFLLRDLSELDAETIANTWGKLPRVHSVLTGGDGTRSFFDAAMHLGSYIGDSRTGETGETAIQKLYFPSVSSITLYGTNFVGAHPLSTVYSGQMPIKLLQDFLIQRRELGIPIQMLRLRGCLGLSHEDMAFLKEIVADVDCDTPYEDATLGELGNLAEENEEEEEDQEDEKKEDEGEEDEEGENEQAEEFIGRG